MQQSTQICLFFKSAKKIVFFIFLHDALLDEECLETDSSFPVDGFHLHNDEPIVRECPNAIA